MTTAPDAVFSAIHPLVQEMWDAKEAGLHFVALIAALAIPDMLAALSSDDGLSHGSSYQQWFVDQGVAGPAEAKQLWEFRCSFLHQGSTRASRSDSWIAFTEPTSSFQMHHTVSRMGGDEIRWLSIPAFVDDILQAAALWTVRHDEDPIVLRNLERFVRRRPEGMPPGLTGVAVYA